MVPAGQDPKVPRDRGRDGPPNLGSSEPLVLGSSGPGFSSSKVPGPILKGVKEVGRAINRRCESQRRIGETTTALSLAVGAAMRDLRVLLIDGDPQANATMTMLDGQPVEDPTIGHVLLDQAEAHEAIRATRVQGVDIIPADAKLADAALMLSDQLGRERRLRGAMLPLEGDYDLVIIDAAPTMGLVTINVVNYVRELLVPVDAGLYSVAGLGRLQETVEQVRQVPRQPQPSDFRPGHDPSPQ